MKIKFIANLIIVSLFFLGCVSTKNIPVADSDIDDFSNHTITVPKRGLPDFGAFTADKGAAQAAFGLIGGIAGAVATISEGNRIVRENEIEDPANYISAQLVSALSDQYQMTYIDTDASELESEDVEDISRVFEGMDYVLDVRTINWSFWYFPTDFNNYRVMYSSKLRLIDIKKSIAIAEGFCSRFPEKDEHAPSYDELLMNNAERLKSELKISADYCIDYFKNNILGLQSPIQVAAKIDTPQVDKGDFVSTQESPDAFNTAHTSISELEAEKMRIADEEAQIERLRLELAQLKAESGQGEKTEQPKLASIPSQVQAARISLRKVPRQLNERHIKNMLLKYHFFDVERNPAGNFANDFIANPDGTITDRLTGLIWQKSGSTKRLLWIEAARYVQKLNKERFAGFSNWRLPTVEELASLMMRNKKQGLYLSSLFDNRQKKCWSADSFSSDTLSYAERYQSAWIVEFVRGNITWARWSRSAGSGSGHTGDIAFIKNLNNFVRAVRSLK